MKAGAMSAMLKEGKFTAQDLVEKKWADMTSVLWFADEEGLSVHLGYDVHIPEIDIKMEIHSSNCAFCKKYPGCTGCPISLATEKVQCDGTPWHDFITAIKAKDTSKTANCSWKMFEFVKSLRVGQ